jgi:hypothetical protein
MILFWSARVSVCAPIRDSFSRGRFDAGFLFPAPWHAATGPKHLMIFHLAAAGASSSLALSPVV